MVALERIRELVQGTDYAGELFVVGGFVRDELLGKPSDDADIVTTLPLEPLLDMMQGRPWTDAFAVYPRFGTAMVRVDGFPLEFVTARKESYAEDSRKPAVERGSLLDDVLRRDFTVNTLMRNLSTWELLDLTGSGVKDLEAKVLRTPVEPGKTFFDDPLRMLRAVRFRNRLGFSFAPGLREAISANAFRLQVISAERIQAEFSKMMTDPSAPQSLQDLMELGLIHEFAPEFETLKGVSQGKYHHLPVWEHTMLVVQRLVEEGHAGDLTLMLGGLLHDIGKPSTRSVDEQGNIRFFSHEAVGGEMAKVMLGRLRYSQAVIDSVVTLVRNHMRLGSAPQFSPSAARRVWRDLGDDVPRLLALVKADTEALAPGVLTMDLEAITAQLERVRQETPPMTLKSPLSGEEVMALLGIGPGKAVGDALQYLTEQVLEGELSPSDTEKARALLLAR